MQKAFAPLLRKPPVGLCDLVTDKSQPLSYNVDNKPTNEQTNIIGEIKMNPFIQFMASTAGRIVRIVAGIALIAWGLAGITGTTGIIVAVVGALPLAAGLFDFCVFAPLFGAPLSGPKIRGAK
ncbi:MAG TPA: DUF2892 domain-containing protein [Elusimicrobiota bacterium]|nr:DUF2892 domain-containing protein [Elusimicrobiota bacterium]